MTISGELVLGALAARWTGAAARHADRELLGWLSLPLLPAATWVAAGAVGIVAPAWMPAVATPVVVGLVAAGRDDRWLLGVDAALVLAAASTSVPAVPAWVAVLAAAGTAAAWLLVDRAAAASGAPGRVVALVAAAGIALAGLEVVGRAGDEYLYSVAETAPGLALLPTCRGERVEVGDGSVAWLDRPRGAPPHPTALFLHGADRRGARQPSACVLRRALLDRGYAVLALDHPGYGASAAPDSGASPEAWDPRRPALEALSRIRASPDLTPGVLVGHSMGAVDAIRIADTDPAGVEAVVLVGAAVGDGGQDEDYWHRRFHTDRGLEYRLPEDRWREIERRYYSADRALGELDRGHPPVVFVSVEREWEHLLEGRETFFERIPGEKSRRRLEGASHYLNSFFHRGVMVTDAAVLRGTAGVVPPPGR